MRSSRAPSSSLSSVSSRTYMSDKNRHRTHSSRHSIDSDVSSRKSNRKMKFIIAIGIALPIIAAIIVYNCSKVHKFHIKITPVWSWAPEQAKRNLTYDTVFPEVITYVIMVLNGLK
ncbi:hypothetical protein TNCV_2270001 [Trichonephila clavipes]|nr:hypothetical protein TNCV_2270001 [Trichonephila clavipes]